MVDSFNDSIKNLFYFHEVEKHTYENDCWIIIDGIIYDVSNFINFHPGGKKIILSFAGKDVTHTFKKIHSFNVLKKFISSEMIKGEIILSKI